MAAVLVYRIHPAVGIARVGNSDQHYVAPETDAAVHDNPTGHSQTPTGDRLYRDNTGPPGKLLRQAARFRIFEFKYASPASLDPASVKELSAADWDIRWTVELANKKSFDKGATTRTDTNRIFTTSASTTVGSGAASTGTIERSLPGSTPDKVTLATLKTEQATLLIVPGSGATGHVHATDGAARGVLLERSPGWWDDLGDGPVKAEIRKKGTTGEFKPVVGAWVVLAAPAYGGPVRHVITLYDVIFSLYWTDKKLGSASRRGFSSKYSFVADVHPLLHRTALASWVSNNARVFHGPGAVADYTDAARLTLLGATRSEPATDARLVIFRRLKTPPGTPLEPTPPGTPSLIRMPPGLPPLTAFQYRAFQAWAVDAAFALDWTATPPKPSALDRPAEITRAHLLTCSGGFFIPGVEVGKNVALAATWSLTAAPGMNQPTWDDAFRLDPSVAAGDVTKEAAVPWQTDMLAFCIGGFPGATSALRHGLVPFWPGARPLEVRRENGSDGPWGLVAPHGRILGAAAVDRWTELGILRKVTVDGGKVEYREHERIAPTL